MTRLSISTRKIKYITMLLVLLAGLLTMACGKKEDTTGKTMSVYYLNSAETKVEAHELPIVGADTDSILNELLRDLSTTPEKLEYKAPLNLGFTVLSMELEDGRLSLDMSGEYATLKPTTEVLVRAALVRTLTQLDGVSYIGITVNGSQLYDSAGELVSWMNADQFIDNDGNEINTYELVRVKLYFANADGNQLIAAYREKHYSTNTPIERFVVEELIAGPSGQIEGLYSVVNPDTKIISVSTRDGVCYVNLDSSFLTVVNNVSTEVSIYAIVNSLAELDNINKVQILINGEVPATFSSSSYERNLDYVTTLDN